MTTSAVIGRRALARSVANSGSPAPSRPKQIHRGLYRIAYLVTVLLVWWVASNFFMEDLLPKVGATLGEVWDLFTGLEFYEQMWATMQRVLLGFSLAYAAGMILGIAMGRSKRVEAFLEMYIIIGMSQPGLFAAMILLVALGLKGSTAIFTLAFLATPIITTSVWQGAKNLDGNLAEVSTVFGYSLSQRVRHVILPQLSSSALAGLRQGLGITWKYVVMIEMIGLNDGVGYEVTRAFQLFNLQSVVAWTICFMTVVLALEYVVIGRVERRLFKWRDRPTWRVSGVENLPAATS